MAIALQNYLRTFKYSTHVTLPPAGRDSVDYFLFDSQEGYCEYYSSAMVVMLRALGIPAREATGYAPGEYDARTRQWTVRESSSHAWPEVYFPAWARQQFEPTPSQSVLDRPDTQEAAMASPTPFIRRSTPAAQITRLNRGDLEESPTPFGGSRPAPWTRAARRVERLVRAARSAALLVAGLLARAWSDARHRQRPPGVGRHPVLRAAAAAGLVAGAALAPFRYALRIRGPGRPRSAGVAGLCRPDCAGLCP